MLVGARPGRPHEDRASRIIAEMLDHSIEDSFVIGKSLSYLATRWRSQGPENRCRGALSRRQTFASRHLQTQDDRWILRKEEASKEMAVWRRLIPWQMSHGVG